MNSLIKTTTSCVLAALASVWPAGCFPPCSPTTNEELAVAAERCDVVVVRQTQLENLSGAERMVEPAFFEVAGNANLRSVSEASGALGMSLEGNNRLERVEVAIKNRLVANGNFELADIEMDPIPDPFGGPNEPIVNFSPSPRHLRLRCGAPCEVEVRLADVDGMVIEVGEPFTIARLVVSEAMSDWLPLQGAGVPTNVSFLGAQDPAVLQQYRNWLSENGFSGEFKHCDGGTCIDFIAEGGAE